MTTNSERFDSRHSRFEPTIIDFNGLEWFLQTKGLPVFFKGVPKKLTCPAILSAQPAGSFGGLDRVHIANWWQNLTSVVSNQSAKEDMNQDLSRFKYESA